MWKPHIKLTDGIIYKERESPHSGSGSWDVKQPYFMSRQWKYCVEQPSPEFLSHTHLYLHWNILLNWTLAILYHCRSRAALVQIMMSPIGPCWINPSRTEVYLSHQNQNAKNIGNFTTLLKPYNIGTHLKGIETSFQVVPLFLKSIHFWVSCITLCNFFKIPSVCKGFGSGALCAPILPTQLTYMTNGKCIVHRLLKILKILNTKFQHTSTIEMYCVENQVCVVLGAYAQMQKGWRPEP
jgi:hypothetical protein